MTETDVAGFDEIDLERLDLETLDAPALGAHLDLASLDAVPVDTARLDAVPVEGPALEAVLPSTATPDRVVVALVAALARSRGLPERAVALAHPLHAPDAADRLVVDLARCRGTSERVVRLTFGLPVTTRDLVQPTPR